MKIIVHCIQDIFQCDDLLMPDCLRIMLELEYINEGELGGIFYLCGGREGI